MRFYIRPFEPGDADWVLAAEAALQAHEIAIFDKRLALTLLPPESSTAAYLDMLWPMLAENHGAMLIGCDEGGRRLGLVAGHVVDEPFPTETPDCTRYGYVSDIYIMPEARGSGLAGQLLDAIAAHLHAADPTLTRLRINVLAANAIARAAYEKAGFVPYEIMYERKLG
ncbi:acetyltransferase (GNAT) family protein [Dongia mobilis]|uniref:Acetyltransferase (GNAT) family protein n=1 Tax=Dongia mobilis TaxID=578943 RepID=A0A4R6WQP2_9PROT|nr:GNAT family N-acetyltransferase [Dongia mobilis]TDQ81514.1 acetyltransferase (GNAT) family protein [Dongia mobilis]